MKLRNIAMAVSIVGLCFVAGMAIYALVKQNSNIKLPAVGTVSIGGPFQLTNHLGETARTADYSGKLMLVQFGYTFCPDVCPTELQKAAVVLDLLGEDRGKIQVLFITIDPERDTADVLRDYVSAFHEDIIGLTGTRAQIKDAAKAYRVYYAKAEADDDGAYLMDHSVFTFLMDGEGRYLRHFTNRDEAEFMAEQIRAGIP